MSTDASAKRPVIPNHGDAIQIVPLDLPRLVAQSGSAAPGIAPQLTYRGGPLLTSVEVFTIFWGSAWQQAPNDALLTQMNDFFDFILTSALLDQLGEHSVAGQSIGHGRRIGTVALTTAALGRSVTDTAIQHTLQRLISTGTLPPASTNRLFFV